MVKPKGKSYKGEFFKLIAKIRLKPGEAVQDSRGWLFREAWDTIMYKKPAENLWQVWGGPDKYWPLNNGTYGPFQIRKVRFPLSMVIGIYKMNVGITGWFSRKINQKPVYVRRFGHKLSLYSGHTAVSFDLDSLCKRENPFAEIDSLITVLEQCKSDVKFFSFSEKKPPVQY